MRAAAPAGGVAFCAAAGSKTRPAPRTRPAASANPLICLTAMLLSPRYMVESFLFEGFPVGVHTARPVTEQCSKTANDLRLLGRTVVALADVVAQVEEEHVVGIDHELPVALTHSLLRAVRSRGRAPEKCSLLFWQAALENR